MVPFSSLCATLCPISSFCGGIFNGPNNIRNSSISRLNLSFLWHEIAFIPAHIPKRTKFAQHPISIHSTVLYLTINCADVIKQRDEVMLNTNV